MSLIEAHCRPERERGAWRMRVSLQSGDPWHSQFWPQVSTGHLMFRGKRAVCWCWPAYWEQTLRTTESKCMREKRLQSCTPKKREIHKSLKKANIMRPFWRRRWALASMPQTTHKQKNLATSLSCSLISIKEDKLSLWPITWIRVELDFWQPLHFFLRCFSMVSAHKLQRIHSVDFARPNAASNSSPSRKPIRQFESIADEFESVLLTKRSRSNFITYTTEVLLLTLSNSLLVSDSIHKRKDIRINLVVFRWVIIEMIIRMRQNSFC